MLRTLVRSPLTLGVAGLLIGLAVAAGLRVADSAIAASAPVMTVVSLGVVGLLLGLPLGGLVTARPDHSRVYLMASDAARARDRVVVALATVAAHRRHARDVLSRHSDEGIQSA